MSLRPGDRQMIKEWNIALVLDTIRRHEPIPQVEIARRTRLGRSTISGIIGRLLREDLVEEVGSTSQTGTGRRAVLLQLKARSLAVVGVKLGPGGVVASLVDLHTEPIATVYQPLRTGAEPGSVVDLVADAVRAVVDQAGYNSERLLGVGLVLPGVVDPLTGTSLNSYFPQWRHLPLRVLLEERLEQPVLVDNDANAVTLAEHRFGAGRGVEHMLGVTIGVGVGAGLIINGRLHRGVRNGAGELGHMTLDSHGPLCVCGKKGCLEALVGDRALVTQAAEALASGIYSAIGPLAGTSNQITREIIVNAARAGDRLALDLLSNAGERLGLVLASAIDLISPSRIVISGESALQAGDLLLEPVRQSLARWVFDPLQGVEVVLGQLSTAAWVRGAAALVLDEAFQVALHDGPASLVALPERVGSV